MGKQQIRCPQNANTEHSPQTTAVLQHTLESSDYSAVLQHTLESSDSPESRHLKCLAKREA